jgi:Rrf2 family protein
MFSKTFGYAIRALAYLTQHHKDGKKIGLTELSHALDMPQHFLGKILQDLVRHGIIDSTKGPSGGFFANDRTAETHLVDVLKITDGNLVFESCALGIKRCNAKNPCSLHEEFAACRNGMLLSISRKTIGMLAQSAEEGKTFLVR